MNYKNLSSINNFLNSSELKSHLKRGNLEGCPSDFSKNLINIPNFPPFLRGTLCYDFLNELRG